MQRKTGHWGNAVDQLWSAITLRSTRCCYNGNQPTEESMMVSVRAVYRDGKFQPLDRVDLQEGQEVQLQIVEKPLPIQEMIGDMLTHFEYDASDLDEDAILQ